MWTHTLDWHRRRLLSPVVFALGLALGMQAAVAAKFSKLEVTQHGDSYRISGTVYLEAVPQQVYAELIDFAHLHAINPGVRASRMLKAINARSQLVYIETVACVLVFCHTLHEVQRFTEPDPQDIVAVTVPGSGNVKHGRSVWHLSAGGRGTRLNWTASYELDFRVPAFVSPRAIEAELRKQALESMRAIEHLSQEQPEPVPDAGLGIYESRL